MKRVSQLTALALLCGLASFSSLAADMPNAMTLSQLQAQHGTPVDTRASAFYNGWPQTLSGPSGHEPAALNLAAAWLSAMSDEQGAAAAIAAIKQLALDVKIPAGLEQLGVKADDFDVLASNALKDACGFTNPKQASHEEIVAIFRAAM